MTVRCLSRPDTETWPTTNVVPRATNAHGVAARNTLGQFLDVTMMRPLYFSESENQSRIETALDTMTWAERITIEIELQSRHASVHSFDYDPLK